MTGKKQGMDGGRGGRGGGGGLRIISLTHRAGFKDTKFKFFKGAIGMIDTLSRPPFDTSFSTITQLLPAFPKKKTSFFFSTCCFLPIFSYRLSRDPFSHNNNNNNKNSNNNKRGCCFAEEGLCTLFFLNFFFANKLSHYLSLKEDRARRRRRVSQNGFLGDFCSGGLLCLSCSPLPPSRGDN